MTFLDSLLINALVFSKVMKQPNDPIYYFPQKVQIGLWNDLSLGFYIIVAILAGIIMISVIGYCIGKSKVGDKERLSSLVVAVDEDNPQKASID